MKYLLVVNHVKDFAKSFDHLHRRDFSHGIRRQAEIFLRTFNFLKNLSMRISQRKSYILIPLLRLFTGIAGMWQGFVISEFALSLAGFFLVYMAIADFGDWRVKGQEIELKEAKQTSQKTRHEKVGGRL